MLTGTQTRSKNRAAKTEEVRHFLANIGENTGDLEALRLMLRDRCRSDFWFFQCRVYGNADTYDALHMEMCRRYQARIQKRYSLWLLPRSHLKTSCFTEAGTLWELISNPDLRFLIINAKLENAIAILSNIRACVEHNEVFRWLFPEFCPDLAPKELRNRCKWITDRLDFPCSKYAGKKEGNIEVMSVGASLVSKHYDRMQFDDPVNDENTTTKEYRDKIDRWYKNALQLRHDIETSIVRLIGTRWHFDDLYSRRWKEEMARRKRMKEQGKTPVPRYWLYHRQVVEKVDIGGERIAGYDNVQPIWPERFTAENIEEVKEENGSYIFSCQYMNNPLPEEDAVFKMTDIKFIDELDVPDAVVNFISADLAVEETEQGDYWAITVASFDVLGKMYVREIIREKLLTSTFLEHLAALVKKWKPVKVSVETTAFQKTLLKVYKEWAARKKINIPWHEMERGKSSKFKRILSLQPRVERGDFHVVENIKNSDWLVEEMSTFPRATHDDILDTLADLESLFYGAPEEFKEELQVDTYDAVYGALDKEEDEEDESFASDFLGQFA